MMLAATTEDFRALFQRETVEQAPALDVSNLRVQFGGLAALKDVTFQVPDHEVLAIVGQNGAGKSTLLNAVSGLVPSAPGSRITLRGAPLHGRPAWRRARLGLGRAFQDPPLIDDMTLRDNLLVGADSFATDEKTSHVRAEFLLGLLGLTASADRDAGSLSYGARKLIDIARGLMSAPEVLLLDEPTSGLDESEQEVVREVLTLIRGADCLSILMVEHHMSLVRAVSDRVLVLDAGSVLRIAPPEEALDVGAASDAKPTADAVIPAENGGDL